MVVIASDARRDEDIIAPTRQGERTKVGIFSPRRTKLSHNLAPNFLK